MKSDRGELEFMGKTGKFGSGLFLASLLACACNNDDADRLARVGRKTAEKVDEVSGGAPGKLANGLQVMRADLDEVGLDSRVAARLRWDKTLADAAIQVRARGSAIELSGRVADLSQRRRAVELAESTAGVDKVKDELIVAGMEP